MWIYPVTYFLNYMCFCRYMARNLKKLLALENRMGWVWRNLYFLLFFCSYFSDLKEKPGTPLKPSEKRARMLSTQSFPLAPKLAESLLLENPSRCPRLALGPVPSLRAEFPKGIQNPSTSPSSPGLWSPPSTPLLRSKCP